MLKELLKDKYEEIKNQNNLETKALNLVEILFREKKDKGGKPYIEHLIKIKNKVNTESQKLTALLHDTIENINISEEELKEIGFPDNIINNIKILTRKQNPKEDYDKYIERILDSQNIDVYIVKLADLEHNMDISNLEKPTIKDFSRIEKRYRPNYFKIQNKLNERMK